MEMKELLDFIKQEDLRLRAHFSDEDEKFRTLSRMCKLTEEVGELSNEILKQMGQQRTDKLADASQEDLAHEFADVIICTLMLANISKVDIEEALIKKIEKIKKRNY
jgi:NTP pyrophosphatase (non-canonical NTP hydrolase)